MKHLSRYRLSLIAGIVFVVLGGGLFIFGLFVDHGTDHGTLINLLFGERLRLNPVQIHQLQFVRRQWHVMGIFIMLFGALLAVFGRRLWELFKEGVNSPQPARYGYWWLFCVSFLSLFFEVIFIRWISAEVRIFAFFKNVSLIAAYLGLGLGCLVAGNKKRFEILFLPGLALLLIFIGFGSDTYLRMISFAGATIFGQEQVLWGHTFSRALYPLAVVLFYGGLAVMFAVQVLIFIPLGHMVGRGFMGLPRIAAYSVNIGGALAGIYAYNFLTNLCFGPQVWFLIGMVPLLWLLRDRKKELALSSVLLIVALLIQSHTVFSRIWSPYNRLSITDSFLWRPPGGKHVPYPAKPSDLRSREGREGEWVNVGKRLDVNDLFYMDITDFSDAFLSRYPGFYGDIRFYMYNLPFTLLQARNVCIVGSGGGNDVAAALRAGVEEVVAVEIDPIIAALGREYHPEKPYQDPRVELLIDDARHFFDSTTTTFDLVVFGLLDSHSLFSTFSSVRLDNYVYTIEAFERVKRLLTRNGSVVCTFAVKQPWVKERFDRMLENVFDKKPVIINSGRGVMFITGMRSDYDELVHSAGIAALPHTRHFDEELLPLPRDDWPFLYQKQHAIPLGILWALVIMACIGVVWTLCLLPPEERAMRGYGQYFWLGVSFLLVETKSISQLALIWGSTWKVTSIVIGVVLFLILLANLTVLKMRIQKTTWAYVLLLVSLFGAFLYDLEWSVGRDFFWGRAVPTFILLLPLFFAGIIFASVFQNEKRAETALGWNLMGGVFGGFLEYSSVIFGFGSLALLALATYTLSWIAQGRTKRQLIQT